MNPPTTELAIALADANVPEEIIDWEYLEEARRILSSPIGAQVFMVAARCICGWYDYFETLAAAPTHCPKCQAFIPENPIPQFHGD